MSEGTILESLWDKANEIIERLVRERDEAREEIVYLRRQITLDDNWMDPEFGGCTPDLEKPAHLKEMP